MTNEIVKRRIQSLSSGRRKLFELRRQNRPPTVGELDAIKPRGDRATVPVSFAQQRLWFMDQLKPNSATYNEVAAFRLVGGVQVSVFERAVQEVIRRHETLRTLFTSDDGKPTARVVLGGRWSLQVVDVTALEPEAQKRAIQHVEITTSWRPFDLANGPLVRIVLIRSALDEHLACVAVHHIASDAWSVMIFMRELQALYSAFSEGRKSPLPEPALQYADFSAWQREWLQGPRLEAQLAYWRHQLAAPSVTALPQDGATKIGADSLLGSEQAAILDGPVSEGIRNLARRRGATSFEVMFAAFALLLSRLTGQTEVAVGAPIAGRNRTEIENLIGFFVNTLVLRIDLNGCQTFDELLEHTHRVCVDASANQDVPFERIVQEVGRRRGGDHSPLFDILFNFNNIPQEALHLHGFTAHREPPLCPIAKFPVTVYVDDRKKFVVRLLYQSCRFSSERISAVLDQYEFLLKQIVLQSNLRLENYSLLTPAAQCVTDDPALELSDVEQVPVHELVARTARKRRGSPALVQGDRSCTYHQLIERSQCVARVLARAASGGSVVALFGEPSFGLITSMLGILTSGCVVMPLDSRLPAKRLAMMCKKAEAKLLVRVGTIQVPFTNELVHLPILDVDTDGALLKAEVDSNRLGELPTVRPRDPAYIFFTSGTTGQPKAVVGLHKGLSHFLTWQCAAFELGPEDRCAQLTSIGFDVVLRDIFTPLVAGASLHLPDPNWHDTPDRLISWLRGSAITALHTTPSVARSWLRHQQDPAPLPALRFVFFAGEPLPSPLVRRWRAMLGADSTIVNLYGPTETTLAKCAYVVSRDQCELSDNLPVGRAIENSQAFVLATDGQRRCGVGEVGEVVIRTRHGTLGYLGDGSQRQSRFEINPWGSDADDLIYRTGDRGRIRPDGNLELLGRLDSQLKVRGARVAPEEVEAILGMLPGVAACAVGPHGSDGEEVLVAYVVQQPTCLLTPKECASHLAEKLPAASVPSHVVFVDVLPLTANGKIDRLSLREIPIPKEAPGRVDNEPRSTTEVAIARHWRRVLKRDNSSIVDNFFEIGGHSLAATELISLIRQEFGCDLPLKALFDAPTIEGLAALIDTATNSGATAKQPDTIPSLTNDLAHKHEPFPLTDMQQAYWAGRSAAFELGNVATHGYSEFAFDTLDIDQFVNALRNLITRHDMLRAVVASDGHQQILDRVEDYSPEVINLRGMTASEAEARLRATRERLSHQVLPFDHWPLFEVVVSLLDGGRVVVHMSIDALICDAWSRRILGRELLRLYRDPTATLPPLDVSFRDYVLAVAGSEGDADFVRARDYWLARVSSLAPAPELPLARRPDELLESRFRRFSATIEPKRWQQLRASAAKHGLTGSGLICAAYAEVLATWSRKPQFTLNLTLFNRPPLHPQVNELVGDFTSMTLLSVDCTQPTFVERARAIQSQLWADLDHQRFSGVRVLREINRRQRGSVRAMMPIVLTSTLIDSDRSHESEIGTWHEGLRYGVSQTPQVILDHSVGEHGGALVVRWDAVEDLFPPSLLTNMFEAYQQFLEVLVDDETAWFSLPGRLLPAEQRRDRERVNATTAPIPPGLLHSPFEERVRNHPDAIAIIAAERTLTFEELHRRALGVTDELRRVQVDRNQLIAIVMEKGWEQVVAVIGVLQAGAAYMPVDPALPQERIDYLLEQGAIRVVLTQRKIASAIVWPDTVRSINVDTVNPRIEALMPGLTARPEDLAYVIYTSGSTGLPKGVMISHRAALNTVVDINERMQLTSTDRVLAVSSLSFDLSVWDIFGTLAAGATIIIPSLTELRDPGAIASRLIQDRVTVWNSVPALMEMLVDSFSETPASRFDQIRIVMWSGDWIPTTLPARTRRLIPNARLVSLGGATEASIWSIAYEIGDVDPSWRSIPYGRALANQTIHVLNEFMEPCPVWVSGGIFIGGVGVAEGYWRDPERTALSFVSHPATGERLYRTGDIGRYLPDGNVEFLGREDFQVKIRGYRVELGEIENALLRHPEVKATVVVAIGAASGQLRLVAYYVPIDPQLHADDLTEFLGRKVPHYMVPPIFIKLDALPLTANGKVDRNSLPTPLEADDSADSIGDLTPRVLEIFKFWQHTLPERQPRLGSNFFEDGGDSILAIRLLALVERRFGSRPSLAEFFNKPTPAGLAELVEQSGGAPAVGPVSAQPEKQSHLHFLSFAQERLWFLHKLDPNSAAYNLPAALDLRGPLAILSLCEGFDDIVRRHSVLRATFCAERGQPMQQIGEACIPSLTTVDLTSLVPGEAEREAGKLVESEALRPFDLGQGPLLRVVLLRLAVEHHILVVTLHHIVSDAWSIEILQQELVACYQARLAQREAMLPTLPLQFVDYAESERQRRHDGDLWAQQIEYWKAQLKGVKSAPQVRVSRTKSANLGYNGQRERFTLSPDLARQVRQGSRRAATTPFVVFLTAFAIMLHRFNGANDIVVNSSISTRRDAASQRLIGLFLNTVLLRCDLSGNPNASDLLQRMRRITEGAFANADIPFEHLVQAIMPERNLSTMPLTRVAFGLRDTPLQPVDLSPLVVTSRDTYRGAAKFDIELNIANAGERFIGTFDYDRSLVDPAAAARLIAEFQLIVSQLTEAPDRTWDDLVSRLAQMEAADRTRNLEDLEQRRRRGLRRIAASNATRPAAGRITIAQLLPNGGPILIQPAESELDLVQWAAANLEMIGQLLGRNGAILFRGFDIGSIPAFERVAGACSQNLLSYQERSTPRRTLQGKIYSSTEYPADQDIPLHNENSYSHTWPRRIMFFCSKPAESGGETPLADSHRVLRNLSEPLIKRFAEKKVMYVRNYGTGVDLTWQDAFQTSDRTAVEDYCKRAGILYEWRGAQVLRTRQVRDAITSHPDSNTPVWFNQAHLFHVSALPSKVRNALMALVPEEALPRNAYYGDGTPLEPEALEEIREAYRLAEIKFPWRRSDVLLVDNMAVAHGRKAYSGTRTIAVAMADPWPRSVVS